MFLVFVFCVCVLDVFSPNAPRLNSLGRFVFKQKGSVMIDTSILFVF